jgi:DNA uptake protein ComE-like DNA-binding protein
MNFKSYFRFTRSQRSGLFLLFSIIVALQFLQYYLDFTQPESDSAEKRQWLSYQSEIDRLKKANTRMEHQIYPFNPNFITDYKGYSIGMSVVEIDRLLNYRKQNKFVNSAAEFQAVTKVSDSLLGVISPSFKFPDWVNSKSHARYKPFKNAPTKIVISDINMADKESLMAVYGIGPALSERILKQREILGGFVSMEQMEDVYGLSPEVVENINRRFKVISVPEVRKIAINDASLKDLMKFPYFRYVLAKEIITYRSMNNGIKSADDLIKIKGFPVEKVSIIAVYLEF